MVVAKVDEVVVLRIVVIDIVLDVELVGELPLREDKEVDIVDESPDKRLAGQIAIPPIPVEQEVTVVVA